jgi:hypothetical protein
MSCIYAHCKQGGACMYPRADGSRCSLIEPAPSPQTEMTGSPDGWRWYRNAGHDGEPYIAHMEADVELTLSHLRALLATQGLAIVPAAEVTTPGERYMGNL